MHYVLMTRLDGKGRHAWYRCDSSSAGQAMMQLACDECEKLYKGWLFKIVPADSEDAKRPVVKGAPWQL